MTITQTEFNIKTAISDLEAFKANRDSFIESEKNALIYQKNESLGYKPPILITSLYFLSELMKQENLTIEELRPISMTNFHLYQKPNASSRVIEQRAATIAESYYESRLATLQNKLEGLYRQLDDVNKRASEEAERAALVRAEILEYRERT